MEKQVVSGSVAFVVMMIIQALRYVIIAGSMYVLFYVWKRRTWFHRKIQQKYPQYREMRREIAYSISTMFIFGGIGYGVFMLRQAGYTQFYTEVATYGWGYLIVSFVLLALVHDTWFYWTHRLMHHPKLFPIFHKVHHLSHNPSPWAAFAFHPTEAIVEAGFLPIAVLLFPVHRYAIFTFMLFMMVLNVLGHTGFEFYPKGFTKHWLGKWFNTPTHHNMHHRFGKGNYSLYFNLWDRIMGTNHRLYDATFEEVLSRETDTDRSFTSENKWVDVAK
ncbi:MAG: sterol desaturase family protein [Spirosomataceae bacterium]